MKPLGKVRIKWSSDFAYALGLLVTDGNLSKDGRHICFTSKDKDLIENLQKALNVKCNIGMKGSGSKMIKKYYFLQIGDVLFYRFLMSLGLMPNKTKIIERVDIPKKYFFDFLRGHLDGDGSFYSYWDPRWKSSFMFYTSFSSASSIHISWIRLCINQFLGIKGHISKSRNQSCYQLKYAKKESVQLLKKIYYSSKVTCLKRKYLKIKRVFDRIGINL